MSYLSEKEESGATGLPYGHVFEIEGKTHVYAHYLFRHEDKVLVRSAKFRVLQPEESAIDLDEQALFNLVARALQKYKDVDVLKAAYMAGDVIDVMKKWAKENP